MRFLYIDDKKDETDAMRKIFELHFAYNGLICETVNAAEEGIERARLRNYDALIVDIMLEGQMDGCDVILKLRSEKVKVPILILSGISSVEQKIKGLGFGADDYMTKPFKRGELLARLQAIIRRAKGHSESVITFGPGGKGKINIDSRTVYVVGYGNVNLTSKEYSILELLALRKGSVISKEAFLNHLYGGYEEPHLKIVDVFCCKTRKKLNHAFLYAKNAEIQKLKAMIANNSIYKLAEFRDKNKNYIDNHIARLEEQDTMSSISTLWGRGYVLREFDNNKSSHNINNDINSWNDIDFTDSKLPIYDDNLFANEEEDDSDSDSFANEEEDDSEGFSNDIKKNGDINDYNQNKSSVRISNQKSREDDHFDMRNGNGGKLKKINDERRDYRKYDKFEKKEKTSDTQEVE